MAHLQYPVFRSLNIKLFYLKNKKDKYLAAMKLAVNIGVFTFEGLASSASSSTLSVSLPVHGDALLCVMFRPTCLRTQINPHQNLHYLQVCHITTPRLATLCLSNCGSKLGRVTEVMAMGFSSFQTTPFGPSCPSYFSYFQSWPLSSSLASSSSRSFWASSKALHRFIFNVT